MIYADNAATTRMSPEVIQKMTESFSETFGNPSSSHSVGMLARKEIQTARGFVADLIGATPDEVYFTSGGTESNNIVLRGLLKSGSHFITSEIEHPSILKLIPELKKNNVECAVIKVNSKGVIAKKDVVSAMRSNTKLVSIMTANNEIGTIQPIKEIGQLCKELDILFHTDAVQSVAHINTNVESNFIDLLSLSAHKFHGPKGVGALFVRAAIKNKLNPLIFGGGQETGLRGGTENVNGIIGLGLAANQTQSYLQSSSQDLDVLCSTLTNGLSTIDGVLFNGDVNNKLNSIINVSFEGVNAESLQTLLNLWNICVSVGSACSSHSNEISHVLKAMGLSSETASRCIRISLSRDNTLEEVEYMVNKIKENVSDLRKIST